MHIDDVTAQKLQRLAQGYNGKFLIEYLEKLEKHFSDIRTLDRKDEVGILIREGALNLIRENLTNKLKILNGTVENPIDDYR